MPLPLPTALKVHGTAGSGKAIRAAVLKPRTAINTRHTACLSQRRVRLHALKGGYAKPVQHETDDEEEDDDDEEDFDNDVLNDLYDVFDEDDDDEDDEQFGDEDEEDDEDDFGADDEEFDVGAPIGYCGPPLPTREEGGSLAGAQDLDEDGKPMWLKDLENDIENDPEVRDILNGTDGDPAKVRQRMVEYRESYGQEAIQPRLGVEKPMRVHFRSFDPMSVYFWLELYQRPSPKQMDLLNEVIRSWFMVGKLGGYNAMNLQVHTAMDEDLSHMPYRQIRDDDSMTAFYHELSEVEDKGTWVRFRADLGTGDDVGLDILINMLQGLSSEYLGIKQLCIGGENEDWTIPDKEAPEVSMNPMRTDGDFEQAWDEAEDLDINTLIERYRRKNPATASKLKALQRRLDSMELDD